VKECFLVKLVINEAVCGPSGNKQSCDKTRRKAEQIGEKHWSLVIIVFLSAETQNCISSHGK
jgi:CDGSH-type Zn-finger protein